MKIFLTGEIQAGKSTIIAKTLELLQITPGGFRTYFGLDRESPERLLYMNSADEPPIYKKENAIVKFAQGKPPLVLTEKFDIFGGGLIRHARANSRLILMDECGNFERDAFVFQKEILDSLDSNIPVLGVIKLDSHRWTDKIRNHPKVRLLTVTKENRGALTKKLVAQLAPTVRQQNSIQIHPEFCLSTFFQNSSFPKWVLHPAKQPLLL